MGLGPMDGRLLVKRVARPSPETFAARLAPLSRLRLGFVGGLDGGLEERLTSLVSRLTSARRFPHRQRRVQRAAGRRLKP